MPDACATSCRGSKISVTLGHNLQQEGTVAMAAMMILTFPPQPRPKQPQACTDGHFSFASATDWIIVGTRVALYALGLNFSKARAFSSVSVGNQSGSAGLPLNKSGMTTRHGTEAARRSAPRRVGWRKPKASKMRMMPRSDDSEPVMSFDGRGAVSGILNTRDDGTCGWLTGFHVAHFLVVPGRFVFSIARCHVVRKGGTLVCGFVQVKLKFGRLLT